MRDARPVAVVTVIFGTITVFAACTSSTILGGVDGGSTSAGTSGLVERPDAAPDPVPRARATVSSSLQPSSEPRGTCPIDGPYVALGTFAPSAPLEDRTEVDGLQVRIYCHVIPADASGTAFKVSAFINLYPEGSPSAGLEGTIHATGWSRVVFHVGTGGDVYVSNECYFTLPKATHGIAPGSVRGEVSCYRAETDFGNKLCSLHAEVRFENCLSEE